MKCVLGGSCWARVLIRLGHKARRQRHRGAKEQYVEEREAMELDDLTLLVFHEDKIIKTVLDDGNLLETLRHYCGHFALRNEIREYSTEMTRRPPPGYLVIVADHEDFVFAS